MGVATITNPSGSGVSTALTNDQNLVNDMVRNMQSAQVAQQNTAFQVTQYFSDAILQTVTFGLIKHSLDVTEGGGDNNDTTAGGDDSTTVATTAFANLLTWKSWISCTLVRFRVQPIEVVTLGGSDKWAFQLYKGPNRSGASWTSMLSGGATAEIVDGNSKSAAIAVSSVAVDDLLRVAITKTGSPVTDFQVELTFTTASEAM